MPKFTDNDMEMCCLIKSKKVEPCFMCGEPTEYIEYCCEGRLCSTECMNTFYEGIKGHGCTVEDL